MALHLILGSFLVFGSFSIIAGAWSDPLLLLKGPKQAPSGPGCFPVYPTVPAVDPTRRTGNWYNYKFLGKHPARFLDWYNSQPLGWLTLPASQTPALVTSTVISWYPAADSNQCVGQFVQIYLTKDGREAMTLWNSDSPYPSSLVSYALYDDYDTMQIRYLCGAAPDPANPDICPDPNLFLNTRTRPDQLSSAELARVQQVADRVLARYCFSTAGMSFETWLPGKAACNVQTSSCYNDLIHGFAIQTGAATA